MAIKPSIKGDDPFEVNYQAVASSGGMTLLVVFWVPNHGHLVPPPQEVMIAPGTTGTLAGVVPPSTDARRIEIRVDLPDGTGKGILQFNTGANLIAEDVLTEDVIWTSGII